MWWIESLPKHCNAPCYYDNDSTINFLIFWDFLMFYQFFLPPEVKRCTIITWKYGIHELTHELPNDLRLRILRTSKNESLVPNLSAKIKVYLILAKKFWKIKLKIFPVACYFTSKLELISHILWTIVSGNLFLLLLLRPDPSKLNVSDNFGNAKAFHNNLT